MVLYSLVRFAKLGAVLVYTAAAFAALLAPGTRRGKRLAHQVASPALLAVWVLGGLLSSLRGTSLTQPWLMVSIALSFLANLLVVSAAERGVESPRPLAGFCMLIGAILALMVFRPF